MPVHFDNSTITNTNNLKDAVQKLIDSKPVADGFMAVVQLRQLFINYLSENKVLLERTKDELERHKFPHDDIDATAVTLARFLETEELPPGFRFEHVYSFGYQLTTMREFPVEKISKEERQRWKEIAIALKNELSKFEFNYEIKSFLDRYGVPAESHNKVIVYAKSLLQEEKLKTSPKRGKMLFRFWTVVTVLCAIFFFAIVPDLNILEYSTLFSVLGALFITGFAVCALIYYKSWEPSNMIVKRSRKRDFTILVFFLIPALVIGFILSASYNSAEENILRETQLDAVGVINHTKKIVIPGRRGKSVDTYKADVTFMTQKGEKVNVSEDINIVEYRKLRRGDRVNLIYSEENPNYVQLLISDHDIKEFKGTEQRMLEPRDLIRLINDDRKTVDKKLNHILRGWEFDEEQKAWTNKDKNLAMWQGEDAVFLLTREPVMFTYPRKFVESGFTQTNENEKFEFKQKEKLFDSDKYGASIERTMEGNGLQYLVKVWKK